MIRQLLDGVTSQMIETLRLDSASELLDEIDKAFHDVIIKNTNLYASFLKAKGDSISLKESKQSCDLYHQAYLMKPDDNGLKELEMIMLRKKNRARLERYQGCDGLREAVTRRGGCRRAVGQDQRMDGGSYSVLPGHTEYRHRPVVVNDLYRASRCHD